MHAERTHTHQLKHNRKNGVKNKWITHKLPLTVDVREGDGHYYQIQSVLPKEERKQKTSGYTDYTI